MKKLQESLEIANLYLLGDNKPIIELHFLEDYFQEWSEMSSENIEGLLECLKTTSYVSLKLGESFALINVEIKSLEDIKYKRGTKKDVNPKIKAYKNLRNNIKKKITYVDNQYKRFKYSFEFAKAQYHIQREV